MTEKLLNLKRFKPQKRRFGHPLISISQMAMTFNSACLPYLNNQKHCELYYDDDQKIMAIKFVPADSEFAYKICQSNNKNIRIGCRSFLIEKDIIGFLRLFKQSVRMRPTWDDKNKMFIVDLKQAKEA